MHFVCVLFYIRNKAEDWHVSSYFRIVSIQKEFVCWPMPFLSEDVIEWTSEKPNKSESQIELCSRFGGHLRRILDWVSPILIRQPQHIAFGLSPQTCSGMKILSTFRCADSWLFFIYRIDNLFSSMVLWPQYRTFKISIEYSVTLPQLGTRIIS